MSVLQAYTACLLVLNISGVYANEMRLTAIINFLIILPVYGRVLGFW